MSGEADVFIDPPSPSSQGCGDGELAPAQALGEAGPDRARSWNPHLGRLAKVSCSHSNSEMLFSFQSSPEDIFTDF